MFMYQIENRPSLSGLIILYDSYILLTHGPYNMDPIIYHMDHIQFKIAHF